MTEPAPEEWSARLIHGDCIEAMQALETDSIDSIVSDPPYGLEFMGREWDTFRVDERSARWSSQSGAAGGFGEMPGGSMLPNYGKRRTTSRCRTCGKRDAFRNPHECGESSDWVIEYVDVVPVEMRAFQNWCYQWAVEALRVLKPGGHVLAFGGTRTYHRLACALEDAGFDIRDSLHWIYGSGFPKSLDVSKQIDKTAGAERTDRVVSEPATNKVFQPSRTVVNAGSPVTAAAAAWQGWGTALKPAHEPIVLARKPLSGTVTETVLEHGTGALNIGGARIGTSGGTKGGPKNDNWRASGTNDRPSVVDIEAIDAGRWPSNVLLAHLPECQGNGPHHTEVLCAPGCPVAELNEMSGETVSASASMLLPKSPGDSIGSGHGDRDRSSIRGHEDQGGAARFFYVAKPRKRERIGGTMRNLHPCLPPGELVLTDEGYEPIETIEPGRLVYADDGDFHLVTEVFSSPCDGLVYEIDVDGTNMNCTATGNHPFLAWRPKRVKQKIVGGDVDWVRADELEPGDYLMTPVAQVQASHPARRPAWWFAAGLWCAEGSVHTNQHGGSYPAFTIGDTKKHLVDALRSEFTKVGVYKSQGCSKVVVMQKEVVEDFLTLVDRGATNKRIRPAVLGASRDCRQAFLDGYEAGDGSLIRGKRRAKTASLRLASTLPLLIESLGVRSAMYRHDYTGKAGSMIDGREIKQGVVYQLYALDGDYHGRPVFAEHDGHEFSLRRVAAVDPRDYIGPVWNLSVAGRHTFQTTVGMSHNTVKPIDLMRYLTRLVTQPGGIVLDPFLGSGTTGCAAMIEGFRFVGIEKEDDSFETARGRISDYAFANGRVRPT